MSKEGQAGFNYGSMFSLSNTILLRGVGTSQAMENAMLSKELLEKCGGIFSSIVTLKLLNFGGEEIFNK